MARTYNIIQTKRSQSLVKRLYSALAMLFISSILLLMTSYAWMVLSISPETSNILTNAGANGALEIALNVNAVDNDSFSANEGLVGYTSAYDRNPFWGNIIDVSDPRYGLQEIELSPSMLNYKSMTQTEVDLDCPFMIPKYGTDGRIGMLTSTNGNFSYNILASEFITSTYHGVRVVKEQSDAGSRPFAYGIDLLFRTDAENANLLLQTEGINRIYNGWETPGGWDNSDEQIATQGEGSSISTDNANILPAIRIAFIDTITGEVYGIAAPNEDGYLYLLNDSGSSVIRELSKDTIQAVTAWVFLDGTIVNNQFSSTDVVSSLAVNLQFSTDAVIVPAYLDINSNLDYSEEFIVVGTASNLHFRQIHNQIELVYDYPDGITESVNSVMYNVNLTNSTTGNTITRQTETNSVLLTQYTNLAAGTYDYFSVDSKYKDEVVSSSEFNFLSLAVSDRDGTADPLYVRIDPTSAASYYAYTYMISGLTPNTPFILYTASESVALGTSSGPSYSAVTTGISDSGGNVTANLNAWSSIQQLKDDPDQQGAELTKLYFKIIEYADPVVSEDGLSASLTRNIRSDWTHYTPGGVGADENQSGSHSGSILWAYTTDGTLTLSGSGDMETSGIYPWSGLEGRVTNLVIEDGITSIGDSAFVAFKNLKAVSFGKDIVKIGAYAFWRCEQLRNFELPYGIKVLGDCAFRDCSTITTIMIPDSVTEINTDVLSGCTQLETVMLPKNLTTIPQSTFAYCRNLKSVVVPDGVTGIGLQAFMACEKLTSVALPISLKGVTYAAFEGTALTDVYYAGTEEQWNAISIGSDNGELKHATIHYESIDPWAQPQV